MAGKSIFEQLAPYSEMVIDQSRGVTVGSLQFASAQDYWSTAGLPVSAATAGLIASNSEDQFFITRQGQTGNVITATHDRSLTNNRAGDRMASNMVYVGLAASFDAWHIPDASTLAPAALFTRTDDLSEVAHGAIWSLNVGDGIKREISAIGNFAGGCPVYSAGTSVPLEEDVTATTGVLRGATYGTQLGCPGAPPRQLPLPVIFPPNITTDIRIQTGHSFILGDTTQWAVSDVCSIKMTFEGFMMTLPA